jgi:hypothetical protein
MQTSKSRLVELDFFRGLVLLFIVVDHIGGSIVSRATLHAYALCDAAEVFVFLGGFATATAYAALAERRNEAIARNRFFKRSLELYRAFLVTAVLMLVVSAVMGAFSIDAPNLATTDLEDLMDTPAAVFGDILLFRRQPYLASVLPMYAFFALAVPAILPLARSKPWLLLAGSLVVWAVAPSLLPHLPVAEDAQWDFNPFAWQLMFVLGVVARCQPVYQRASAHRHGWMLTALACAIVAAAAYFKLFVEVEPLDSSLKQNLSWLRAVNFIAIAWLAANLVRIGWAKAIAVRLPWIGLIGRQGMLCFIAGTVISLVVDSLLYAATDGYLNVPLGLVADAVAIGALIAVAKVSVPISRAFTPTPTAAATTRATTNQR